MPREGIDSVSHRQVFREEIRNAIREAIFSGKLNPGDRIIETYWAKELGVSQGLSLIHISRHERPPVEDIRNLTPCVVVDQQPIGANARSTVGTAVDAAPLLRLLFSRVGRPSAGGSMAYSMNHPHGMCPDCTGLGVRVQLDEERMFDREKSIREGAIRFSQFSTGSWQSFY